MGGEGGVGFIGGGSGRVAKKEGFSLKAFVASWLISGFGSLPEKRRAR